MKKLALAALLAAVAAPALAAPAPLPNVSPAMWVVKDDDTTVYLFGTFHMLDGKRDWFNDEVKAAFDASSEVVLEVKLPDNPAELQPMIMKYAVDPKGKTLSQKLSPEVKSKLDKGEKFVFVDCRLPNEYAITNIEGATLIPLQQLPQRIGEMRGKESEEVIVHCRSGARSLQFAQLLKQQGFKNVKSMAGGILLWNKDVNPGGPQY